MASFALTPGPEGLPVEQFALEGGWRGRNRNGVVKGAPDRANGGDDPSIPAALTEDNRRKLSVAVRL